MGSFINLKNLLFQELQVSHKVEMDFTFKILLLLNVQRPLLNFGVADEVEPVITD